MTSENTPDERAPQAQAEGPEDQQTAQAAAQDTPDEGTTEHVELPDDGTRWAIGLMSGTSLDGIDAALLKTDGEKISAMGPAIAYPYPPAFRNAIYSVFGGRGEPAIVRKVEKEITRLHAQATITLMDAAGFAPHEIAVVGFHGQTIDHRPKDRYTKQLGDGQDLSETVGVPVVYDFRSADVAAGGEGAPLVPIFHLAMAKGLPRPIAILNLGGVGNVTYLGEKDEDLLAFDTGPGNALIDDWMYKHTEKPEDQDGETAAQGTVDEDRLAQMLDNPWFQAPPPKSLDRGTFMAAMKIAEGLSMEDGAATLTAFTAATVAAALPHLPQQPKAWFVCGGGRHNKTLMAMIKERLQPKPTAEDEAPAEVIVDKVEAIGWHGDALEAQAFAFLAMRHVKKLPQTFPRTTGCPEPMTGGRLVSAFHGMSLPRDDD